jgi:hypothetical protein
MKRYEIYRNIRKRALLFGLPVSHFALMMVIFSFSIVTVVAGPIVNVAAYLVLLRIAHRPIHLWSDRAFPEHISNKRSTELAYEED